MSTPVIRYKVVRQAINKCLYSLTIGKEHPWTIRYPINEWVEAQNGGILVFNDYKAAYNWAWDYDAQLWEVEVEEPMPLPRSRSLLMDEASMVQIWRYPADNFGSGVFTNGWPNYSEAFKRVKLTKLIREDNEDTQTR